MDQNQIEFYDFDLNSPQGVKSEESIQENPNEISLEAELLNRSVLQTEAPPQKAETGSHTLLSMFEPPGSNRYQNSFVDEQSSDNPFSFDEEHDWKAPTSVSQFQPADQTIPADLTSLVEIGLSSPRQ